MKILKRALVIIVMVVAACATTPKTLKQDLYAAEWTLVAADTSLAKAYDTGLVRGTDYAKAAQIALEAGASLRAARTAFDAGNTADASAKLSAAKAAIDALFAITGGAK